MRNAHCKARNMSRKLKIMENQKYTIQDVKHARKLKKLENVEMSTERTWNMARKLKIMENEKHPIDDFQNDEITEKRKNEKCTLQDLEYGEKTENHGK